MEMREILHQSFQYDLWANEQWLSVLEKLEPADVAKDIFGHILFAQHLWLQRCISVEEVAEIPSDLNQATTELNRAWQDLIRISDPYAYVSFNTMDGNASFRMLEEIARHVANHGTYHRGELRGLARAQGFADFPETDFMRYLRLHPSE